jgi:hypothetical protein
LYHHVPAICGQRLFWLETLSDGLMVLDLGVEKERDILSRSIADRPTRCKATHDLHESPLWQSHRAGSDGKTPDPQG